MIKNLIWYRAGMAEGAHPMITGFFRLKDRGSRRPGFPIESRWAFFRRRVREHAHILREYVKIYLEMQELWLKTRIRGEEYAFLGDLRKLASCSTQEVKVNWGHIHTVMDERLGALRESIGAQVTLVGTTMAERLEALRDALGNRATAVSNALVGRANAVRESPELSLCEAARNLTRRALLQAVLGDLRLKYLPHLPPAKRRTPLGRAAARINVFSLQRLEARREHVADYWQRTWHTGLSLEFWRLNPFALTWNLARDIRHAMLFFFAMLSERY